MSGEDWSSIASRTQSRCVSNRVALRRKVEKLRAASLEVHRQWTEVNQVAIGGHKTLLEVFERACGDSPERIEQARAYYEQLQGLFSEIGAALGHLEATAQRHEVSQRQDISTDNLETGGTVAHRHLVARALRV